MYGTILIYGNDKSLVTTRRFIFEKAGYIVFGAMEFSDAMLVLLDEHIDVLIVCQSLLDAERQSVLETAKMLRPDIKFVIMRFDGRDVWRGDAEAVEGLEGPDALLKAIDKILTDQAVSETLVVGALRGRDSTVLS